MNPFHIKSGCFPKGCFCAGLGAGESAQEPFKNGSSVHHSPVGLLGTRQSSKDRCLEGLSQVPILRVEVPDVGTIFSSERSSRFWVPFWLWVAHHARCGFYGRILSQPFISAFMWFPSHLPSVKELLCQFLGFWFFF